MTFKTELELQGMSKKEIDAYGDSIGLKLDRRLKKEKLIKQVLKAQEASLEDEHKEREEMQAALAAEQAAMAADDDADVVEDTPPEPKMPENEDAGIDWRLAGAIIGATVLVGGALLLLSNVNF